MALARISPFRPLRWFAFSYVSIFRGTPLLIQILLIYFGLPSYGIVISPIPSALLALSLFAAAYLSENFRSGMEGGVIVEDASPDHFFGPSASQRSRDFLGLIED